MRLFQTIQKAKLLSNNSFFSKPQHFHEFFTQKNRQFSWDIKVEFLDKKIWQFFLWNQSCQLLKIPKLQHFHKFFTQKNLKFSWEIKVEFFDSVFLYEFQTRCSIYVKQWNISRYFFILWHKVGGLSIYKYFLM